MAAEQEEVVEERGVRNALYLDLGDATVELIPDTTGVSDYQFRYFVTELEVPAATGTMTKRGVAHFAGGRALTDVDGNQVDLEDHGIESDGYGAGSGPRPDRADETDGLGHGRPTNLGHGRPQGSSDPVDPEHTDGTVGEHPEDRAPEDKTDEALEEERDQR
jgi:hypothetical protein